MIDANLIFSVAEEFKTPFYLIDEKIMLDNLNKLRDAFSGFDGLFRIAYSVKANFNPLVLKTFESKGTLFDVASEEELFFLKKTGLDASNVIYSSVSETREELEYALSSGVQLVSMGSKMGLLRLDYLLRSKKAKQNILIRVNPDIEAEAVIPASGSWSKFGLSLNGCAEDSARFLLQKAKESPFIEPVGVHFHLGSQVLDPKWFSSALDIVLDFLSSVRSLGLDLKVIDVGGGYPVRYNSNVPPIESFSSLIIEKINDWALKEGKRLDLIVESGRFLIASAGFLVTSVVNLKRIGEKQLAILDAGYNLLLDSLILKQSYPVRILKENDTPFEAEMKLAGNLCDSFDFLIPPRGKGKGIRLPALEIGDLVIFEMTGAYTNVFNLPFNCKTKPPIIFRTSQDQLVVARARESIEELYEEESPRSLEH